MRCSGNQRREARFVVTPAASTHTYPSILHRDLNPSINLRQYLVLPDRPPALRRASLPRNRLLLTQTLRCNAVEFGCNKDIRKQGEDSDPRLRQDTGMVLVSCRARLERHRPTPHTIFPCHQESILTFQGSIYLSTDRRSSVLVP